MVFAELENVWLAQVYAIAKLPDVKHALLFPISEGAADSRAGCIEKFSVHGEALTLALPGTKAFVVFQRVDRSDLLEDVLFIFCAK